MSAQHALPRFDMRALCPACGQASDVLAQWSPFKAKPCVCRTCSERFPFPMHIITIGADGQPTYTANATYEDKNTMVGNESALRRAMEARRKPHRPAAPKPALDWRIRQYSMPICERCGQVHDHKSLVDYAAYCQRCDDELSVERYLEMLAHRQMDDETALDHLYQYRRELFDRGVLPDFYYIVKLRKGTN